MVLAFFTKRAVKTSEAVAAAGVVTDVVRAPRDDGVVATTGPATASVEEELPETCRALMSAELGYLCGARDAGGVNGGGRGGGILVVVCTLQIVFHAWLALHRNGS
jgi:hypothetical protein